MCKNTIQVIDDNPVEASEVKRVSKLYKLQVIAPLRLRWENVKKKLYRLQVIAPLRLRGENVQTNYQVTGYNPVEASMGKRDKKLYRLQVITPLGLRREHV